MSEPTEPRPAIEIPEGGDPGVIEVPDRKPSRRDSLYEMMQKKMDDQDFTQKIKVTGALLFEFYRVMMGAMLIIFVPQQWMSLCRAGPGLPTSGSVPNNGYVGC